MKFASLLSLALAAPAAAFTQGNAGDALQTSRQELDDLEKNAEQLSRLSQLETNEGKTQHALENWCDQLPSGSKAVSNTSLDEEEASQESEFKVLSQRICERQEKVFEKINNQDLAQIRQEVTGGSPRLRGAQPQAQQALVQKSSGVGKENNEEEDDEDDEEEDEHEDVAKTAAVASKDQGQEASKTEVASQKASSESDSDEDEDDDEADGDDQASSVTALLQKLSSQAKTISFMQLDMESFPATNMHDAKQWCALFTKGDQKSSGWAKTIQEAQDESTKQIAAVKAAQTSLLQQQQEIQTRGHLADTRKQQVKSVGDLVAQLQSSVRFLKENCSQATEAESDILSSHQELLSMLQDAQSMRQKHVHSQEERLAALEKKQESDKLTLATSKKSSEKAGEHLQKVHGQVAGIMKACKQISGRSNLELLTQGMALS